MSDQRSVKDIFNDIGRELDGDTLEGEISSRGLRCKVRLLNEEESNWRYAHVDPSNTVAVVNSYKLPTLSIGIRELFHEKLGRWVSVYEFFDEDWESLPDDTREALLSSNKFFKKYFVAEHLMEWLGQREPGIISDLYNQWTKLEERRKEAQENLKKSSGEGSEEKENESSTEPSPDGDD